AGSSWMAGERGVATGVAAMEPGLVGREQSPEASTSRAGPSGRNGARPRRPGAGALAWDDEAGVIAAMEPGLVGREQPVRVDGRLRALLSAAMEPGLVGREQAEREGPPLLAVDAAMEPGLVGREQRFRWRVRVRARHRPQWSPAS